MSTAPVTISHISKQLNSPQFLIIGGERSGTHWVAALLNNHPDVACFPTIPFHTLNPELRGKTPGEMHFFNTIASLLPDQNNRFIRPFSDFSFKYNKVFADLVPLLGSLPNDELVRIYAERYSDFCEKQRGTKRIVGEGTPAYVFHLALVDSLYPGIKKMFSIRDPKDKIVSWHFSLLNKNKKTEKVISDMFIQDYLEERIIPEYEALLNYKGSVHCLTYEALHRGTSARVADMLDYLEIEYTDDNLAYMVAEASFKKQTARDSGTEEGRSPGEENPASAFRKGIAGDWVNHLTSTQAQFIDDQTRQVRAQVFQKYSVQDVAH